MKCQADTFMPITSSISADGKTLTIAIDGRFDFSAHQEFRKTYEQAAKPVSAYWLDMSKATYLDSSALGMLLLLRDYAGGDDADITIAHCSEDVKKILTISNFQQLFKIS
jgi:anti-anti-sigma factor